MVRYIIDLSEEERKKLLEIISTGKHPAYRIKHAHILLNSDIKDVNLSIEEISKRFRCHRNTVSRVRQRYVEEGFDRSLERKKRETPPTPSILDGEKEAKLLSLCCSIPPEGWSRWTLQLLSDKLIELNVVPTISKETVGRVLKKMNLSLS